MSIREFTDAAGRAWQVWATVPATPREEQLFRQSARLVADAKRRAAAPSERFSTGREDGWLTFMTGEEKRRLSPIPPRWAEATDAELAGLLARAQAAPLSEAAARLLAKHTPPAEEGS
ncbi:MAG: hypothetical protein M3373_10470 [Gemmatimonadota bacterium]|nr:hypothetical protein [Gemmatimonadota bacterium]